MKRIYHVAILGEDTYGGRTTPMSFRVYSGTSQERAYKVRDNLSNLGLTAQVTYTDT